MSSFVRHAQMYLPDTITISLQTSHVCVSRLGPRAISLARSPGLVRPGHIVCLALSAYLICLLAHETKAKVKANSNVHAASRKSQAEAEAEAQAPDHVPSQRNCGLWTFVARYRKLFWLHASEPIKAMLPIYRSSSSSGKPNDHPDNSINSVSLISCHWSKESELMWSLLLGEGAVGILFVHLANYEHYGKCSARLLVRIAFVVHMLSVRHLRSNPPDKPCRSSIIFHISCCMQQPNANWVKRMQRSPSTEIFQTGRTTSLNVAFCFDLIKWLCLWQYLAWHVLWNTFLDKF